LSDVAITKPPRIATVIPVNSATRGERRAPETSTPPHCRGRECGSMRFEAGKSRWSLILMWKRRNLRARGIQDAVPSRRIGEGPVEKSALYYFTVPFQPARLEFRAAPVVCGTPMD
jgi:hypothetical protein